LTDVVDTPQLHSCVEAPLLPQATMALGQRASAEVFRGTFGAKAAETRESVAQKRERTWRARDGTVGVAQYVIASPWAHWASESSAI